MTVYMPITYVAMNTHLFISKNGTTMSRANTSDQYSTNLSYIDYLNTGDVIKLYVGFGNNSTASSVTIISNIKL